MPIIREFNKLLGIIVSFLLISVSAYIINTSLDYYNQSIENTQEYGKDCVEIVKTVGESKTNLTTVTLCLGDEEQSIAVQQTAQTIENFVDNPVITIAIVGNPHVTASFIATTFLWR
jgi:hypothetical protein